MSLKNSKHHENQNRQITQQPNEQPQVIHYPKRFFVGKYLGGFPNVSAACEITYCSVEGDTCKFTNGMHDKEYASIPLSKINTITVEDIPLIHPRTKQDKSYFLVIDWDDKDGTRQYSFFEFAGSEKKKFATDAAEALKTWQSREEINGEKLQPQTT